MSNGSQEVINLNTDTPKFKKNNVFGAVTNEEFQFDEPMVIDTDRKDLN